jgi:zinc/manganese transport system substrate-binding protein
MNKSFFIALLLAMLAVASPANAEVNIFACEPEWAAVAQEIGGDKVNIKTATTAKQDPHHIQARPGLMAAMRTADMVFCTGAELEVGWLPVLLKQAGKRSLQPGEEGSVMAADYVQKLEIPTTLDRSQGDVHAEGNPHIQTDPHNIGIVAKVFAEKISKIDSANAEHYKNNYTKFSTRWENAIQKWQQDATTLKGKPIIVQHNSWVYLVKWLGLEVISSLEPKPGIPPSSAHLASVLEKQKTKPAQIIIYAPSENNSSSKWLSERANIPAVELPFTVGGNDEAKDLFSLFDSTIVLLKQNIK